jgi:hypothetical protein
VRPVPTTTPRAVSTLPTSVATASATTLAVEVDAHIPVTTATPHSTWTPWSPAETTLTREDDFGGHDVLLALVSLGLLFVVALLATVLAVMCVNHRRRRHRAQYELPPVVDGPIFRPQREE